MNPRAPRGIHPGEGRVFLALIGLIVAVGMVNAHRASAPTPPPANPLLRELPNYLDDPASGTRRMDELARRAKGRYEKLTEMEQRWVEGVTAGHGARMIEMRWAEMQRREKALREAKKPDVRGGSRPEGRSADRP